MNLAERTRLTYRYERWRAACAGVLESAAGTFFLLIAVQWFEAPAWAKALVVAGGSVGLMTGPLVVAAVEALGWPAARAAARIAWLAAGCFALAAAEFSLGVYVAAVTCGSVAITSAVPLLTQIYQENYPPETRGQFFTRTFMVRIVAAAAFGHFAGRLLAADAGQARTLVLVVAGCAAAAGACLWRVPSSPLAAPEGARHPLRGLRHVRDDRLFRQTLISWMLMGFGNLIMLPLRIEFLANPAHGIALPADAVALYTAVIPNLARLVLSPAWGWAFDRLNFFALRTAVNCGFALYIVSFFLADTPAGLTAGAILFGISAAGGDVAWALWVTKLAPPARVADYMAVHTFLTGLRGVLAPVIAFQAAAHFSFSTIALCCTALIVLANVVLLPELRARRPLAV